MKVKIFEEVKGRLLIVAVLIFLILITGCLQFLSPAHIDTYISLNQTGVKDDYAIIRFQNVFEGAKYSNDSTDLFGYKISEPDRYKITDFRVDFWFKNEFGCDQKIYRDTLGGGIFTHSFKCEEENCEIFIPLSAARGSTLSVEDVYNKWREDPRGIPLFNKLVVTLYDDTDKSQQIENRPEIYSVNYALKDQPKSLDYGGWYFPEGWLEEYPGEYVEQVCPSQDRIRTVGECSFYIKEFYDYAECLHIAGGKAENYLDCSERKVQGSKVSAGDRYLCLSGFVEGHRSYDPKLCDLLPEENMETIPMSIAYDEVQVENGMVPTTGVKLVTRGECLQKLEEQTELDPVLKPLPKSTPPPENVTYVPVTKSVIGLVLKGNVTVEQNTVKVCQWFSHSNGCGRSNATATIKENNLTLFINTYREGETCTDAFVPDGWCTNATNLKSGEYRARILFDNKTIFEEAFQITDKELCESTGGEWEKRIITPGSCTPDPYGMPCIYDDEIVVIPGCTCPEGTTWTDAKGCVTEEPKVQTEELCESTEGTWLSWCTICYEDACKSACEKLMPCECPVQTIWKAEQGCKLENENLSIQDKFTCGNWMCEDITCNNETCPERETEVNCPEDCSIYKNKDRRELKVTNSSFYSPDYQGGSPIVIEADGPRRISIGSVLPIKKCEISKGRAYIEDKNITIETKIEVNCNLFEGPCPSSCEGIADKNIGYYTEIKSIPPGKYWVKLIHNQKMTFNQEITTKWNWNTIILAGPESISSEERSVRRNCEELSRYYADGFENKLWRSGLIEPKKCSPGFMDVWSKECVNGDPTKECLVCQFGC